MDNAGGNDKNNGLHAQNQGDTASPVRTIAKALRLARAGDRIVLANSEQPYRECVALVGTRHSGAARLMPFILDGNGATLDGSAPIPGGRLDPFPRQYLPLPAQGVDPGPSCFSTAVPFRRCRCHGRPLSRRSWNRWNGARSKGPSTSPSKPAGFRPTTS